MPITAQMGFAAAYEAVLDKRIHLQNYAADKTLWNMKNNKWLRLLLSRKKKKCLQYTARKVGLVS